MIRRPTRLFAAAIALGLAATAAVAATRAVDDAPGAALKGKPAPDFKFSVLGKDGQARTVTKADLAGKVVLIDFWATWCGPCLKEMPEVDKLIGELADGDRKDKVVVVALSIDDGDPADLAEVRSLVEQTLATKKLTIAREPVGLVALDPKMDVANAFGVESIPFLVVLDQEGIVRAVHVGYDENVDVRAKLNAEIDALLAGKPIAEPDAK